MKKILTTLHWQILIAMILGVVFGYTLNINPEYLNNSLVSGCYQLIVLLGSLFVRSLKMIMIPLIFTSIIILLGLAIVAIPAGLLASALSEIKNKEVN